MVDVGDIIGVEVDFGAGWVPIDIDPEGFTFRELDVLRGELLKLNEPTERTQKLMAAWLTWRRANPDVSVDAFLDLPFRAFRDRPGRADPELLPAES